jgi:hypothetical protein
MTTEAFFAYARARYAILLRRQADLPRSEWTDDPILQKYRFCNVFREDDVTTKWFRENVRDPLRNQPEVLLATVVFRWFNRITTGEAIFCQDNLIGCVNGCTAWESLLNDETSGTADMKMAILAYCGKGPYVTGAYIIKTYDGMPKLPGVLKCIRGFMNLSRPIRDDYSDPGVLDWREVARVCLEYPGEVPLETVWNWLRKFPYLGDFMAYEIVSDLRYTALLDKAPDIMTWANPGPGAMRGLNRIHGRDLDKKIAKEKYIEEMRVLLGESQNPDNWPSDWQPWDMRTVEHTLCELDKYERVRLGQGRPRGVYR